MRRHLPILPLLLVGLLPAAASAAELKVVRVFTGWRDAASFQRVSEFLHGQENTGGIDVLRSQPAERAGYYWLVRLQNGGPAVPGAKFELQVIGPAAPEPKTFTFPFALAAGSALYDLGLTGADWPNAKSEPAAWQLRILDADGRALVVEKSFLWEMPPKP